MASTAPVWFSTMAMAPVGAPLGSVKPLPGTGSHDWSIRLAASWILRSTVT